MLEVFTIGTGTNAPAAGSNTIVVETGTACAGFAVCRDDTVFGDTCAIHRPPPGVAVVWSYRSPFAAAICAAAVEGFAENGHATGRTFAGSSSPFGPTPNAGPVHTFRFGMSGH